ncbi:MAG TPA: MerR family transcriptional regulator [Acidimicrobiia bacterium]
MPGEGKARAIGEVLEELVEDFPDISVSKIRFLEAQGLITPGRTPSGYRQFSESDVALLRWILAEQREHYLPLKVIRRRLREGDGPRPGATAPGADLPAPPTDDAAAVAAAAAPPPPPDTLPAAWYLEEEGPGFEPLPEPVATVAPPRGPAIAGDLWSVAPPGRTWTAGELASEVGLEEAAVTELAAFGLLPDEDEGRLGEESLRAARAAAGFFRYGVEARHLRMYKTFAEREAALFEQVILPMASTRHEDSGPRAREALAELAHLGQALRLSMLRSALGPPAGERS